MEARSFDDVVDVRNGLLLQEEVMNEDEDALDTFEGEGGREAPEKEASNGTDDAEAFTRMTGEGGRDETPA